jgi:hypothetical protein
MTENKNLDNKQAFNLVVETTLIIKNGNCDCKIIDASLV